jgi:hypothetical protein
MKNKNNYIDLKYSKLESFILWSLLLKLKFIQEIIRNNFHDTIYGGQFLKYIQMQY